MTVSFLPRVKPGTRVDQLITASVRTPVEPVLPAVAIGPMNLVINSSQVSSLYAGALLAFLLPGIEAGAKVNTDKLVVKLSAITVTVLGEEETLSGTVAANPGMQYLDATSKTGLFVGLRDGDTAEVTEAIATGSAGVVATTGLTTLTEAGAFTSVLPGDDIVVTDAATNRTVTTTVTAVAVGGGSLTTADELPAGSSLTWTVTRFVEAIVKAVVTDTRILLDRELSKIGAPANTFKIKRKLVPASPATAHQPLAANLTLSSSNYALATTNTTDDSLEINADLRISGFNAFNQYPFKVLSSLELEVDTTTTIIKNQTAAVSPITFSDYVAVGDIIKLGALSTRFKVLVVNTTLNKITLDQSAGTAGDPFTSMTIPDKSKLIDKATITVSYVALRTANANKFIEIPTDDVVESNVGVYDPDNPLGVAVTLMAANTGTKVFAVPVESNDETGFLKALAILESKTVYNVVALSQSLTVQGYVKSHADAMSTPIKAKWRVGWGNLAQPTEAVTVPVKGGSLIVATVAGDPPTGTVFIYNPHDDFTLVNIGDYIKIFDQDNVASTIPSSGSLSTIISEVTRYYRIYEVLEKTSTSKLKLKPVTLSGSNGVYTARANSTVPTETATYVGEYTIIKLLTKSEEAQIIANTAASFSDRRFLLITNGTCILEFNGVPIEVPGYYIAAALAGLSSGTLPHQPLTNFPIAGIKGIRGGSEHFDDSQQGIIAAGGGFLVVQDILDTSIPYPWQQLSTSQGGVKEQEFSFTKNLDEISYALVADTQRFPGRNNNVEEARAAIESQARATLEVRKTRRFNSPLGGFLGSQIVSYTFTGILPDPLIKDLVYSDITLELPLPLNTINFRLIA